jgi:hypothetical protein
MVSRAIINGWPLVPPSKLPAGPVNTVLPAITGLYVEGQTLSVSAGTWTAFPAISAYGYQWRRDGQPIQGATNSGYALGAGDVGHVISAEVTAFNSVGLAAKLATGALVSGAGGNIQVPSPVMLESFDDGVTGFTLNNAAVANDPTNKVQGANAQRLTNTVVNSAIATKTLAANYDPATFGVLAACVDYDTLNITSLEIDIGRSNVFAPMTSPGLQEDVQSMPRGKTWISRHVSEMGANVPVGSGALQVRTRFSLYASGGQQGRMTTDCFVVQSKGIPTSLITMDDGYVEQFTVARPIANARGLKLCFHPNPAAVDLGDGGNLNYMTTAMLQQADSEGHLICCDNVGDLPYTSFATRALAVKAYTDNRAWLIARGLTRGIDFGCYPGGNYAAPPVKAQSTGATVAGAAVTLAGAPGLTLVQGMRVYALGLPTGGTTIATVTDQTHITLNNAPSASATTFLFVDETGEFAGTKLPDDLRAAGAKLMRTNRAVFGTTTLTRWGFGDQDMYLTGHGYTGVSAAQADAIDVECELRGTTDVGYWHSIRDSGGSGFDSTIAYFTGRMDGKAAAVQAGRQVNLTYDQLWGRDSGGLARLQALFP